MKRFLFQIAVFAAAIFGLLAFWLFSIDGEDDAYYLRFTTPQQTSLIIGTSRAAQGMQPAVFNRILHRHDIYNYSFSILHSPYGPSYFRSIRSKVDTSGHDGVFIVCVDPWTVSSFGLLIDGETVLREWNGSVHTTKNVSQNPNFEYLRESFSYKPFAIFLSDSSKTLHDDGWMEISIAMDSASIKSRTTQRMAFYEHDQLPFFKLSEMRLLSLDSTVQWLQNWGEVYLVRLPVSKEMMRLDDTIDENFNEKMLAMAHKNNCAFRDFNAMSDTLVFTDGNHLHKHSGKVASTAIAQWIREMLK